MKGGEEMNKNAKTSNKTLITIIVIIVLVALIGIALGKNSPLLGPTTQCNDRVDNDGDRKCDYGTSGRSCRDGSIKGDSGCSSSSDNSEASCVSGSTTCGVGSCLRTSTCVSDAVSCTPGAPTTEVCDSIDNDCNGLVDDNLGSTTCGVGVCQRTVNNCLNGNTQTCVPGNPTTEVCTDTLDNDCNGIVNNGCVGNTCSDTDGGSVPSVVGTVSGVKSGQQYSLTDFCLTTNSTYLDEYHCDGTNPVNASVQCYVPANGTTSCNAGACF